MPLSPREQVAKMLWIPFDPDPDEEDSDEDMEPFCDFKMAMYGADGFVHSSSEESEVDEGNEEMQDEWGEPLSKRVCAQHARNEYGGVLFVGSIRDISFMLIQNDMLSFVEELSWAFPMIPVQCAVCTQLGMHQQYPEWLCRICTLKASSALQSQMQT